MNFFQKNPIIGFSYMNKKTLIALQLLFAGVVQDINISEQR